MSLHTSLLKHRPALAALAFTLAPVLGAHAASHSVTVDFAKPTVFNGVGAQIWAGTKRPVESDALLKDMNAKLVRVSFTPNAPYDQLVAGMSVAQMTAVIEKNDTPQQQQSFTDVANRMATLGVSIHQIIWADMPVQWLYIDTTRGAGKQDQSRYALSEHIPDYANLITARLLYGKKLGIVTSGVELTNEPHGAWGIRYTPEQYAELVNTVRKRLDENGLQSVSIDGPGTGLRNWEDFRPALESSGAIKHLKTITAHVYQSPEELANPATPGVTEFMGKGAYGPITISEFGVKWDPNAVPGGPTDQGSPAAGVRAGVIALNLLRLGAQQMSFWQMETFTWAKTDMGMIDLNGARRPSAFVMQTLFGKVPVGSTTVAGVGAPLDTLPVQAFRAPDGKIHVLVANATDEVQTVSVSFANVTRPKRVLEGTVYNGTGLPVAGDRTQGKVSQGVFTGTLQPQSVASVILQ